MLFHLLLHSLFDSCMCPAGDRNNNLGVSGQHSNEMSYPIGPINHLNGRKDIDLLTTPVWSCSHLILVIHLLQMLSSLHLGLRNAEPPLSFFPF